MPKSKAGGARHEGAIDKSANRALVSDSPPLVLVTRSALGTLTDKVVREGKTALLASQLYALGDASVVADVYFVSGLKSTKDGPWLGEADKIAWLDEASGYECIIMRASGGGHLCGYVGVPPEHPLYGFEHEAIPPNLDIEVHGGLSYSALCQHGPSPAPGVATEARRICHVSTRRARHGAVEHATDYRVQRDDAWWFGFECNHVYDVVPDERSHANRFLAAETGAVYRDEAYVHQEVINLAAQLRAIESGEPKPQRQGPPLPPIGLDPRGGN
ncbi:MAG: hypothetical protein ACK4SZ_15055 [Allosphingosinicella sp.]|uniref:hypothetical protein n=1 Tax=Allosphingosinicella sp. TaxID=2823234 RepID=UPI003957BB1D